MTAIIAIGTSVPEFIATNQHVISPVLERSEDGYAGNLNDLERDLRSLLERVGSRERRWRSGLSTPIAHVIEAWENCISRIGRGGVAKIGALIYCGIDRGIAEPSHASLLAKRLGLLDLRCLDISDACMGWYSNLVPNEKECCRTNSFDVGEIIDRAKAAVLTAMVNDRLSANMSDARQSHQFLDGCGVA